MLSHQMQSSLATYDISIRMLKNNGKLSNKVQISLGPSYWVEVTFFHNEEEGVDSCCHAEDSKLKLVTDMKLVHVDGLLNAME